MRFRIVLVRPRYGGNVGSAVRVAANFGVKELALVDPGCILEDDPEYVRMATGGDRLVTVATFLDLAAAIGGAHAAVATTSTRQRDPRAILTPAEAGQRLAESGAEDVALVFGSERGGLSLDELRSCQMTLAVPTDPDFPEMYSFRPGSPVMEFFRRHLKGEEADLDEYDEEDEDSELEDDEEDEER